MKNTTIAILFCTTIYFGNECFNTKREIKPFNGTYSQSDSISRLKCGTFKRDSLVRCGDVFFRNQKDFNRFYKFYNQNK